MYNNGQRGLIWEALKELEVLAGEGLEEDAEGGSCRRYRLTATLTPGQCS